MAIQDWQLQAIQESNNINQSPNFNWFGNQGNTNEGITSGALPDFQNYYNMNMGKQAFPHTGMQVPAMQSSEMIETNVDQPNQGNLFNPFRAVGGAFNFAKKNIAMPMLAGITSIANRYNPLSKGSQNYNPALAGQIDDLNKVNFLGTQSSPYQLRGGPLAGKNLVSMFGTNDYDQMLADKKAWFEKRGKGKRGEKNYLKILDEIAARAAEKKAKTKTQTTGRRDTSGWGRADQGYTTRGGFTGKTDPTSGGVRGHHGAAQGGYMRSRYNKGGRVGILAAF